MALSARYDAPLCGQFGFEHSCVAGVARSSADGVSQPRRSSPRCQMGEFERARVVRLVYTQAVHPLGRRWG
jgi:hypothetical protein